MMIRHNGILWVLSIAFEIMELTFQVPQPSMCLSEFVACSIGCLISTNAGGIVGSWTLPSATTLASVLACGRCVCSIAVMKSTTGWASVSTRPSCPRPEDPFSNCCLTLGTNTNGISTPVAIT